MKTLLFLLLTASFTASFTTSLNAQSEPFIAHWPIIQQDCCNCPVEERDYQIEYHYYIPIGNMPSVYVADYNHDYRPYAYQIEYTYYDQQLLNELYEGINFYQINYSGRKDDDRFREQNQHFDR